MEIRLNRLPTPRPFAHLPLFFLFLWFLPSASKAELTVASAISMGDALEEISKTYSAATGRKVRHTFAGTNVLARQIEAGAPIDLFVSADTETMDALVAKRLIGKESVQVVATNELVVVYNFGGRKSFKLDSARSLMFLNTRFAIADPDSVPAGKYAKKWLTEAGAWGAVSSRMIRTPNVRAALMAAEAGDTKAAIVYRSDAISSKKVKIILVADPEKTGPIEYPAGVVSDSQNKAEALAFLEFLSSEEAREILIRFGFAVPKKG